MIMRGEEVVDGMKSIVAYRILISYCEQIYVSFEMESDYSGNDYAIKKYFA